MNQTPIAWKPIETAPRDGTWFLAACDDKRWKLRPRIVYFGAYDDNYPISDSREVWTIAPTHWAPLPELP